MLRSALLLAIVSMTQANALAIFSNDITDPNPSTANPFTAGQVVDTNLTVSGIGRGPGINANSAQDRYNARDWSLSGLDESDYFTWTLDPADGYALNLDTLNYTGRKSGTGPQTLILRSSLDSFTADLSNASFADTGTNNTPVSVTFDSSFQNLTEAIEFRLFGYGGTGAAGTFSVNDFQFGGSLVLVDITPVESGDFNGDGFIDAADYTIWRDAEGQTGVDIAGDGNNDGTVDALDYAIWSQQYAPAVSEGAAAIPEPGSFVIAIACLLAGARMQRTCN
jgi:hypothetical protein